jgi:hypothetical protein
MFCPEARKAGFIFFVVLASFMDAAGQTAIPATDRCAQVAAQLQKLFQYEVSEKLDQGRFLSSLFSGRSRLEWSDTQGDDLATNVCSTELRFRLRFGFRTAECRWIQDGWSPRCL